MSGSAVSLALTLLSDLERCLSLERLRIGVGGCSSIMLTRRSSPHRLPIFDDGLAQVRSLVLHGVLRRLVSIFSDSGTVLPRTFQTASPRPVQ